MNKTFLKKSSGFSLAEALITLLIVCLITLASIPVLTKKKRSLASDAVHGKWICTKNSEGQTVFWSESNSSGDMNNPDTWDKTGQNYCKFVPPINARNFAVTIAGGGGGGASATKLEKYWTSDFAVEYTGKYRMVAIGAGGSAGQTKCYKKAGGGGAGGAAYLEYEVDENITQIKMVHGGYAHVDDDNYNAPAGGPSSIIAVRRNPSTGNLENMTLIYAAGGGGGNGRWGMENQCRHGNGNGGSQGGVLTDVGGVTVLNSRPGTSSCGEFYCYGYIDERSQREVNNFVSPYVVFTNPSRYEKNQYGNGGQPNRSKGSDSLNHAFSRDGTSGYAMVMAKIYKAGKGGKAGQSVSSMFYPKFEAKYLKAIIGDGGRGGVTNSSGGASNGFRGGDTSLLNDKNEVLIGKQGGAGGSGFETIQTFVDTPGGNGELTTLFYPNNPQRGVGGLNTLIYSSTDAQTNNSYDGMTSKGYGDGGGGGGYSASQNKAGNGADGTPGVVIIEW